MINSLMKSLILSRYSRLIPLAWLMVGFLACNIIDPRPTATITDTGGKQYRVTKMQVQYAERNMFRRFPQEEFTFHYKDGIEFDFTVDYDKRISDKEKVWIPLSSIRKIDHRKSMLPPQLLAKLQSLGQNPALIQKWDGSSIVFTEQTWVEMNPNGRVSRLLDIHWAYYGSGPSDFISGFSGMTKTPYGKDVNFQIDVNEVRTVEFEH